VGTDNVTRSIIQFGLCSPRTAALTVTTTAGKAPRPLIVAARMVGECSGNHDAPFCGMLHPDLCKSIAQNACPSQCGLCTTVADDFELVWGSGCPAAAYRVWLFPATATAASGLSQCERRRAASAGGDGSWAGGDCSSWQIATNGSYRLDTASLGRSHPNNQVAYLLAGGSASLVSSDESTGSGTVGKTCNGQLPPDVVRGRSAFVSAVCETTCGLVIGTWACHRHVGLPSAWA
jgi:hypothetical protein